MGVLFRNRLLQCKASLPNSQIYNQNASSNLPEVIAVVK